MNIEFTKMHGLGNDFVVIDNMNGRISLSKEQIIFLCDRHKGVGADGIILVEPSDEADCFMNYINADGTFAQMCGNGVRCTARFLKENHLKQKNDFRIATRSGIKEVKCHDDGTYSVNMGQASFSHTDFPKENIEFQGLSLNFVSMGNPFAIVFVDDATLHDFMSLGPAIENNPIFPNRMNFELVEQKSKNEFKVRVWERGCGETLACGTGACAIYALARKIKNVEPEIIIEFPGGRLLLSADQSDNIIMRGLAEAPYSGMVEIL